MEIMKSRTFLTEGRRDSVGPSPSAALWRDKRLDRVGVRRSLTLPVVASCAAGQRVVWRDANHGARDARAPLPKTGFAPQKRASPESLAIYWGIHQKGGPVSNGWFRRRDADGCGRDDRAPEEIANDSGASLKTSLRLRPRSPNIHPCWPAFCPLLSMESRTCPEGSE